MKHKGLIKGIISAGMLALVLSVVDLETLKRTFLTIPLSVALLAIVGFSLTQLITAFKWWLLIRASGIHVSYLSALKTFFIGMFANCFGFGTVGGDILRGVILGHGRAEKTQAIASAFADRALGLAMLSLIGVLATIFVRSHHMDPAFVYLLTTVSGAIFLGWVFGPPIILKLVPPEHSLRQKVEALTKVMPKQPGVLLTILGVAALYHLAQIWLLWLILEGMGIDVPFPSLLLTIPFVNIVSTLPISWMGLGVRENAYIFFLYPAILSKEQAIALGAIWLLAITCSSLIGGLVSAITGEYRLSAEDKKLIAASEN